MLYKLLNSKQAERIRRFLGVKTGIYLKLKRFTPSASDDLRTVKIIKNMDINCVIDVGANTGQFAESLYDFKYNKKTISFEPLQSCHAQLISRSRKYPNWVIAERCAIGEKDELSTINVCDDSSFSSLLNIKDSHVKTKKHSRIVKKEEISVFKLDSIIDKYIDSNDSRILLKIDTQGFEKQVLNGASELLKKVIGLKIEIPLVPIYENVEFTFFDIIDFVKNQGFEPYSFNIEGVNPKTGRVNTMDGLFFRKSI